MEAEGRIAGGCSDASEWKRPFMPGGGAGRGGEKAPLQRPYSSGNGLGTPDRVLGRIRPKRALGVRLGPAKHQERPKSLLGTVCGT